MYAEARTIGSSATIAGQTNPALNTPVRIRISPANPARPGKAERRERAEHQRAGELRIARAETAEPREVRVSSRCSTAPSTRNSAALNKPVRDDVDDRALRTRAPSR